MTALSTKTITIVGGGNVGTTLATSLLLSGKAKSVVIAARNPEKTTSNLSEQGITNIPVQSMETAIASGDIIILAVTSFHTDADIEAVAKSLGDVKGKTIVDVTNPLSSFSDGLQIRWDQGTSGGEKLQEFLPDAKVYKAFNSLGVEHMTNEKAARADMMYCGPDSEGIEDVVAAIGYRPIYVGPIRYSRNLEAIAELWIHCSVPPLGGAYLGRDWTFAVTGPIHGK